MEAVYDRRRVMVDSEKRNSSEIQAIVICMFHIEAKLQLVKPPIRKLTSTVGGMLVVPKYS